MLSNVLIIGLKSKNKLWKYVLFKSLIKNPYRTLLLETGNEYIQEGNWWNDTFWGFCLKTNTGENKLGKLIMKIRNELR